MAYRIEEVWGVGVDVELAFCEIIVATCRRGLDWTWIWKEQANSQSPAAFANSMEGLPKCLIGKSVACHFKIGLKLHCVIAFALNAVRNLRKPLRSALIRGSQIKRRIY